MSPTGTVAAEIIWHDVECGAYAADLPLWRELAESRDSSEPVLEVGCGTGRVGLDVARSGRRVAGIDRDGILVAEFNRRARERGLPAEAVEDDLRATRSDQTYGLVLAPMQVIQLLAGKGERESALAAMASALAPGGVIAIALVEGDPTSPDPGPAGAGPPLPDVAEHGGWVYSSMPLDAEVVDGAIHVRRLRQTVSPQGDLAEALDVTRLETLSTATLEREAGAHGMRAVGRCEVPPTESHVGSTVLLLGGPS